MDDDGDWGVYNKPRWPEHTCRGAWIRLLHKKYVAPQNLQYHCAQCLTQSSFFWCSRRVFAEHNMPSHLVCNRYWHCFYIAMSLLSLSLFDQETMLVDYVMVSEKECFLFLHILTSKPDHSRGLSPEKGIINHWCPFIRTHTHATLHIYIHKSTLNHTIVLYLNQRK